MHAHLISSSMTTALPQQLLTCDTCKSDFEDNTLSATCANCSCTGVDRKPSVCCRLCRNACCCLDSDDRHCLQWYCWLCRRNVQILDLVCRTKIDGVKAANPHCTGCRTVCEVCDDWICNSLKGNGGCCECGTQMCIDCCRMCECGVLICPAVECYRRHYDSPDGCSLSASDSESSVYGDCTVDQLDAACAE